MNRLTIRGRLTLGFALSFVAASAVLLGLNYLMVSSGTARPPEDRVAEHVLEDLLGVGETGPDGLPVSVDTPITASGRTLGDLFEEVAASVRSNALRIVLIQGIGSLVVVGGMSLGIGWWLAGRSLRPVREITATVRRLSEDDLSARVNLDRPPDEITELARTFDDMLDRVEQALEQYRNFAATASHELRTPLAVMRVEADNALADPSAAPEHRDMALKVQAAVDRAEAMIEQLMALTRSRSGVLADEPVDLAEVVGEVVGEMAPLATAGSVHLDLHLGDAEVRGDRVLLTVLVANLVRNSIVHNHEGGWAAVAVWRDGANTLVSTRNSGRQYRPDDIKRMLAPFERMGTDRSRGSGLGLATAQAVVEAHRGSLAATPLDQGGLEVVVTLPAAT